MSDKIKSVSRLKTIWNFTKFLENPIEVIAETMDELGDTYITYIGATKKTVMTQDPEIIKHVLQKNHKNYYKSELQTKNLAKYAGKGLLTVNGDYWLKQRRLIQPGFHKERLNGLIEIMNEEIIKFAAQLETKVKQGNTELDLSDEIMELTLKIVSKSLFSTSINEEELINLGKNLTALQHGIVKEVRQPIFNWWRKLNGEEKENYRIANEAYELLYKLIDDRIASEKRQDDLLDMLITARYEDTDKGMSREQLRDEILILFVAGHETTSNALTWMFYNLDQHRQALTKVKTELSSITVERPGFPELRSMEYTTQTINETMRLYPPAWITDRIALDTDEIKDLNMAKGDMIGLYVYGTHRNPKYWERPDEFDPDRFAKENKAKIVPYSYFPFGGGPRLCIGQQFAMMEMQLVLFHLLQKFEFELVDGHPIEAQPLITLRPKFGMKMKVKLIA